VIVLPRTGRRGDVDIVVSLALDQGDVCIAVIPVKRVAEQSPYVAYRCGFLIAVPEDSRENRILDSPDDPLIATVL
jgi:hypothetical protein